MLELPVLTLSCARVCPHGRDRYSPRLRELVVVLLETVACSTTSDLLPEILIQSLLPGVADLRRCSSPLFASPVGNVPAAESEDLAFISCLVARVQLACIMASNISRRARDVERFSATHTTDSPLCLPDDMYSWEFGSGPNDNIDSFLQKEQELVLGPALEPAAAARPAIVRAWYYCQRVGVTMPRIGFLAFTGDPAFGRELHYGMRFIQGGPVSMLRPWLVFMARLARWLFKRLVVWLLWSTRPYMWVLGKSIRGLNRTLHRVGARVAIVERHRPFAPLIGFAHHYPGRSRRSGETEVRLNVYGGSVETNFKTWQEPEDHKGVLFEAVYRGKASGSAGVPRLVSRFVMGDDGTVTHTCLYKYRDGNSRVPAYRIRVPGMQHDGGASSRRGGLTIESAQATGAERANYGPNGRVTEEVVQCTNKLSGGKLFVSARYRFDQIDPEAVVRARPRCRTRATGVCRGGVVSSAVYSVWLLMPARTRGLW